MPLRTPVMCGLLLACCAATAWAQKKPAEETPLSLCVAENRQAMTDLMQALEAARRKSVASPMTVTRLQGVQASVERLRGTLPRGARSLGDCEQVAQNIGVEKEKLQRVTGEGDATPGDLPVGAVQAAPAAPAAAAGLADERGPIPQVPPVPLAPPPPAPPAAAPPAMAPEACREQQARQYNELAQSFSGIAQAGQLSGDRLPLFQSLSERLSRLRGVIADRTAPGWECQPILQSLARIKAELQPLMPLK